MRTLTARLAAPFLLTAALAGLTGCGMLEPEAEPAVRDEESGEIVESSDASVFSLRVGDCLSDTADEEVTSVPTVPCAEPHDNEAYATTQLPDGDYPGEDAVATAGDTYCYEQFPTFVGMAYEESALEYSTMLPTQVSWEQGDDREVLCLVYSPEGQTTGTLKGAAR